MAYIITPVWVLLDLVTLLGFAKSFFAKRNNTNKAIAVFLFIWGIMSVYSCLLPEGYTKRILSFSFSFILLVLIYRGSMHRYILCVAVGTIFIGIIDIIFLYGICLLLGISYSEFVWKKLLFVSATTITKLCEVLFAYLFDRYHAQREIRPIRNRWMLLTLLFPVSSLLMMVVIFVSFQDRQDLSIGAFIYSCILLVANIAILYLINIMEKRTQEEQQLILLGHQMDVQTKSIIALEKSYRTQRKVSHEFMHQLQTINDLLDRGEEATVRQYIRNLQVAQRSRLLNINSHHPILDAILNQKYLWACDQNIKMQFQINDLSAINLGIDELVVLFSNLLDNAIEACMRIPGDRAINCSILCEEVVFISIRNTSLPVTIVNGMIETSKEPKLEHGFGLSSIRHILTKLHAEFAYNYQDGWFHFVAEIPLLPTE